MTKFSQNNKFSCLYKKIQKYRNHQSQPLAALFAGGFASYFADSTDRNQEDTFIQSTNDGQILVVGDNEFFSDQAFGRIIQIQPDFLEMAEHSSTVAAGDPLRIVPYEANNKRKRLEEIYGITAEAATKIESKLVEDKTKTLYVSRSKSNWAIDYIRYPGDPKVYITDRKIMYYFSERASFWRK